MTDPHVIRPVILAGGSGTRLWPVSRAGFPKQFVPMFGKHSLFQETALRLESDGLAAPIVITAEPFRFVVLEQLEDIGIKAAVVLVEPEPKNTSPAVAAALGWMAQNDPTGVMLIAPSDHAIQAQETFRASLWRAFETACDHIVTFGITPTYAETGYGWLKLAAGQDTMGQTPQDLAAFVEKPDSETASKMLEAGGYLWNSGMFLAGAGVLRRAFEDVAPDILAAGEAAFQNGRGDLGFHRLDAGHWAGVEAVSIDYAVMEKTKDLKVQPWDGDWSDLGNWDSVARQGAMTSDGVTEIDCENSYLSAGDGVRLLGVGLLVTGTLLVVRG